MLERVNVHKTESVEPCFSCRGCNGRHLGSRRATRVKGRSGLHRWSSLIVHRKKSTPLNITNSFLKIDLLTWKERIVGDNVLEYDQKCIVNLFPVEKIAVYVMWLVLSSWQVYILFLKKSPSCKADQVEAAINTLSTMAARLFQPCTTTRSSSEYFSADPA